MSIIGSRYKPDADGWLSHRIGTDDRSVVIECRPKPPFVNRPAVVQVYLPAIGRASCIEPDAVVMAERLLTSGESLAPLLDWLLERVELTGHWDYGEEEWVYANDWWRECNQLILENAIRLTVQAEDTPAGA